MIAPDLSGVPVAVALTICRSAALLGKKKNRPFFMKPYSGPEDFQSSCATDPVRFAWYDRIKAACREYQNSVPTYQWTYESIMVTKKILSPGAPERISCPVWLFSAEYDRNVKAYPQEQFIGRVKNGVLVHVKKAKHEIYRSVNSVLYPWWHQVLGLMKDEILPAAQ